MTQLLTIIMTLCLAFGCIGTKTNHQTMVSDVSQLRDSIHYREVVRVDTIRIPSEQVMVRVPYAVFERDTVIQWRNKRVSAQVVVANGQVDIIANCDSLERLVLSQKITLSKYYQEKSERQVAEKQVIKKKRGRYGGYGWFLG